MWRTKAIKWAWITLVINASVALLNLGFTYGHWLKHEYWSMGFSIGLVIINTSIAIWEYRAIVKYRQDIKELMWRTLSTPSEKLR